MQWFKDKRIKWQTLVNKTPYKNNNWTTRTQETKSLNIPKGDTRSRKLEKKDNAVV